MWYLSPGNSFLPVKSRDLKDIRGVLLFIGERQRNVSDSCLLFDFTLALYSADSLKTSLSLPGS